MKEQKREIKYLLEVEQSRHEVVKKMVVNILRFFQTVSFNPPDRRRLERERGRFHPRLAHGEL